MRVGIGDGDGVGTLWLGFTWRNETEEGERCTTTKCEGMDARMSKTSRRLDFIPRCGVKCVAVGISVVFKLCVEGIVNWTC